MTFTKAGFDDSRCGRGRDPGGLRAFGGSEAQTLQENLICGSGFDSSRKTCGHDPDPRRRQLDLRRPRRKRPGDQPRSDDVQDPIGHAETGRSRPPLPVPLKMRSADPSRRHSITNRPISGGRPSSNPLTAVQRHTRPPGCRQSRSTGAGWMTAARLDTRRYKRCVLTGYTVSGSNSGTAAPIRLSVNVIGGEYDGEATITPPACTAFPTELYLWSMCDFRIERRFDQELRLVAHAQRHAHHHAATAHEPLSRLVSLCWMGEIVHRRNGYVLPMPTEHSSLTSARRSLMRFTRRTTRSL